MNVTVTSYLLTNKQIAYLRRVFIPVSINVKLLKSIKILQSYDQKCTATSYESRCTWLLKVRLFRWRSPTTKSRNHAHRQYGYFGRVTRVSPSWATAAIMRHGRGYLCNYITN